MTQFLSPYYLRFTCSFCEVERLDSRDSPFQTANSNWSRMLERLNLRREGSREAGSEGERGRENSGKRANAADGCGLESENCV